MNVNRALSMCYPILRAIGCVSLTVVCCCRCPESDSMPEGLLPILVLIAIVIIYTVAKIIGYMRQSDRQWQQVDKSKLREWEDEDD